MVEGYYFKTRKKKTKKEKVENLYKILGTRSNISQDRIKEKYIEKLREFPPETHPEEFQEIRRAYETLKDDDKRRKYDMFRKYGDKLEKTMDDVMLLKSKGEFQKAKELIDYVLEIYPDDIEVELKLAELFLDMENIEEFYSIIDKIMEECDTEQKQDILFIKFSMLYSNGYYDEAFTTLEKYKEYVTDIKRYHEIRLIVFLNSGDFQQAWGEFKLSLPPTDDLNIENLEILLNWINTGIMLEKWREIPKIQNYIRKLAKSIKYEEELYILMDRLLEEADSYFDVARFKEADVFMQLASQIFKNDEYIRNRSKEIKPLVKLEMELDRSAKDRDLIPYVHVKIVEAFYLKYNQKSYEEFLNDYPHEMMRELECMKEDIAYGILRIKKKYPSLYKEFNKELTELFNESTEGLNREQRRSLR